MIRRHELPMKVSAVDWSDVGHESGRPTATVYLTAPGRVDFRELVRDLAHTLDCKVVLTQLGARDDASAQSGGRENRAIMDTTMRQKKPERVRTALQGNIGLCDQ